MTDAICLVASKVLNMTVHLCIVKLRTSHSVLVLATALPMSAKAASRFVGEKERGRIGRLHAILALQVTADGNVRALTLMDFFLETNCL